MIGVENGQYHFIYGKQLFKEKVFDKEKCKILQHSFNHTKCGWELNEIFIEFKTDKDKKKTSVKWVLVWEIQCWRLHPNEYTSSIFEVKCKYLNKNIC